MWRHSPMNQRIDTSGGDHSVASWIWRNLVPKSGQATTVQGELLRAVEKLRWEAQENGNINWDEGFVILVDYLKQTLNSQPTFTASELHTIKTDTDRLRSFVPVEELDNELNSGSLPYVENDLYDRLTGFVVSFSRANPEPLERAVNPELGR
jgi:hypothetical protein